MVKFRNITNGISIEPYRNLQHDAVRYLYINDVLLSLMYYSIFASGVRRNRYECTPSAPKTIGVSCYNVAQLLLAKLS